MWLYILYGPYRLFCLVRLPMTASFGKAQYGAFRNGSGIWSGFLGTICWLIVGPLFIALVVYICESTWNFRGKLKQIRFPKS